MSQWPAGEHVASVYESLYSSLGAGAGRVTCDAFAIRLHEASRHFGSLVLQLREEGVTIVADALVLEVMTGALSDDESGALALYALSMLVGPRLLVSLRDYLDDESDPHLRELLTVGSDQVIREIRAVGTVVATEEPLDDPAWARRARAIYDSLDAAGMAESLGQRS